MDWKIIATMEKNRWNKSWCETKVDEGISTVVDTEIAIDLTSRFLASTTPKEIFIVLNGSGKMSMDDIIEYLQIDKNKIKIKPFNFNYSKLSIQEEYLKKCFKQDTMVSIIESLNLESVNYARTSLIMLLDYINDYKTSIQMLLPSLELTEYENDNMCIIHTNEIEITNKVKHDFIKILMK